MQTIEYRHREDERKEWGPGPWDDEPDKKQWTDEASGLPCLIVRGPMGAWCGYVGVAEGHPAFQQDYGDVAVEVHGGLTFANFCAPDDKEHGICHVVELGENDRVWWLGFDCGHSDDLVPRMEMLDRTLGIPKFGCRYYRNVSYVTKETVDLAKQLASLA